MNFLIKKNNITKVLPRNIEHSLLISYTIDKRSGIKKAYIRAPYGMKLDGEMNTKILLEEGNIVSFVRVNRKGWFMI